MDKIKEIDSMIVELLAKRLKLRVQDYRGEISYDYIVDLAVEKGLDAGLVKEIFRLMERMAQEKSDEMSGKTGVP